MKTVNDKLYNFEATPPAGAWDRISGELHKKRVVQMKSRKKLVIAMAAAASIVSVILISLIFFNLGKKSSHQIAAHSIRSDKPLNDTLRKNNEVLERIINAPDNKKLVASSQLSDLGFHKKYITISGPEGQPVKISPKVATLIVSADDEYPPKPVWDKKINKWQKIMLTNNVSANPTNLVEILEQVSNKVE